MTQRIPGRLRSCLRCQVCRILSQVFRQADEYNNYLSSSAKSDYGLYKIVKQNASVSKGMDIGTVIDALVLYFSLIIVLGFLESSSILRYRNGH